MKKFNKIVILGVFIYLYSSLSALSISEKDILAEIFKPGRIEYSSLFDESFLKQVSESKITSSVKRQ